MIVALYGILDAITYIIDNHCRNPSVGFDSRSESMSGNCRRGYGSSVMASLKASVAAISAKHFSSQNKCCLGCCTKPTPIPAVDVPTDSLKFRGQTVRKASTSEEHIRGEMESNGVQTHNKLLTTMELEAPAILNY